MDNQENPRSSSLPKIELRDPIRDLGLHPLLKRLPEPDYTSPQWEAFIVGASSTGPENVQPLIISDEGLVMVGGWTWLAAKRLQWASLPCIVRPEWEAAALIVDSLIAERSLTQGAKAYLSLTMLQEFIESAENRRLNNLKNGNTTIEKPLNLPKHAQCASGIGGSGWDAIAERLGVGTTLLDQAIQINKTFDSASVRNHKFEFQDGREMTLKEYFEPKILDPENPMGLGSVLKGIGPFLKDGKPADFPPPKRNTPLFYFQHTWQDWRKRNQFWDAFSDSEREQAAAMIASSPEGVPQEVLALSVKAFKAEIKRQKRATAHRDRKQGS